MKPSQIFEGKIYLKKNHFSKNIYLSLTDTFQKAIKFAMLIQVYLPKPIRFPPRIKIITFFVVLWSIMQVYGLFISWRNNLEFFQRLVLVPYTLQGWVRVCNLFITKHQEINAEMHQIVKNFYEVHENTAKFSTLLKSRIDKIKFWLYFLMFIYFIIYEIQVPVAVAITIYTGEFTYFVSIFLPLTDSKTLEGFILNSILHMVTLTLGLISFAVFDYLMILYGFQVIPMVDILCLKIEALADGLHKDGESSTLAANFSENEEKFKNLIKEICNFSEFIDSLYDFMAFISFGTIALDSLAICLCIFNSISYASALGYSGTIGFLFQVASPCIIGTIAMHEAERLSEALIDFPWYKLPKNQQRNFMILIHYCQNTNAFELPIIGKMNMELYANVLNGAYSWLTFILNFVEV